jgi:hypothetical protein
MEEAVAQCVAQEGLDEVRRDQLQIVTGGAHAFQVVHLDAVDPLHGEHVASGALPIDGRYAKTRIVFRVLAEFGKGGGLQPQIHFDLGGFRERLRDLHGPQAAGVGNVALLQPCGEEEAFEIAGKGLPHAGPYHLHGNLRDAVVMADFRPVNLGDRGGGDGFAEADIEVADGPAERGLDRPDRLLPRKGPHAVLQKREIERDVVADNIGPGRQELAKFDVRRAKPRDGLRQPFGAAAANGPPAREEPRHPPAEPRQAVEFVARQRRDHALAGQYPACPDEPERRSETAHADAPVKASSPNAAPQCRRNNCAMSRGRSPRG